MKKKHSHKKARPKLYTKGELNKMVDSLVHPLFDRGLAFIILDGICHSFVEQNPQQTAARFIKYNLPKIIEQIARSIL